MRLGNGKDRETMAETGARLRMWRRRRRMTQHDLAEAVGYKAASVSAWERGEYDPRPDTIHRLDHVLEAEGELERLYGLMPQDADAGIRLQLAQLVEAVSALRRQVVAHAERLDRLERPPDE